MIQKLDYSHKIKGEKWDKKIENPYKVEIKPEKVKFFKKIKFLISELCERIFKRRFFSSYHYLLCGKYKKFK